MNLKICFSNAIGDHRCTIGDIFEKKKKVIKIIKPNKTYLASHVWQKQTHGSEFSFSPGRGGRDMRRACNLRHAIT